MNFIWGMSVNTNSRCRPRSSTGRGSDHVTRRHGGKNNGKLDPTGVHADAAARFAVHRGGREDLRHLRRHHSDDSRGRNLRRCHRQLERGATLLDGKIYVGCGKTIRTQEEIERIGDGWNVQDALEVLDLETQTWSVLAPAPSGPRAGVTLASCRGKVYIIGGNTME